MVKSKKSLGEIIFDSTNYLFLGLLSLVTIYPLIHVAFASFSTGTDLLSHQGLLFAPLKPTLDGYIMIFKNPLVVQGYLNTIFVIVVGVLLNLFITSLTAYALSREGMMLKRGITLFIIFTMYFSGGLIPFYFTVRNLNLIDNIFVLIIPVLLNTFNMIIMRTSFEAIPVSLEESAKIDGANDFTVLFKIILPLSKPIIAVICLYYGVQHWNSWFNAMLFIKEKNLYPLQLVLREILLVSQANSMDDSSTVSSLNNVHETLKYALIMIATVPILCIYPFVQKFFVQGALVGAVKG